jgi:uncharacterized protein YjbI with pentapeptide repeats
VERIEKNEALAVTERWEVPLKGDGGDLIVQAWDSAFNCQRRDFTAADLRYADIRYVNFYGAILNRAWLTYARSKNALFGKAKLNGANLDRAQLEGANFEDAELQGASLTGAQLEGAWLKGAHLEGANLADAKLQGANLEGAYLQGANLIGAHLQGTNLDRAQLWGANLNDAQLQGVSFAGADLPGASFANAFVWRADARKAYFAETTVDHLEKDAKYKCRGKNVDAGQTTRTPCDWTTERFETLKKMIADHIPEGNNRRDIIEMVEHKFDPKKDLLDEDRMLDEWGKHPPPQMKVYETNLEELWKWMGCGPDQDGHFYVFHGLVGQLSHPMSSPFENNSQSKLRLAAAFLDPSRCPGARGLSYWEKTELEKLRDGAPPPAPKP